MATGLSDIWTTFQQLVRSVNTISSSLSGGVLVRTGMPSFTVAGLPTLQAAGTLAFASNGRKPGQGAGVGTGVLVFYDGTAWISVSSGTTVTA